VLLKNITIKSPQRSWRLLRGSVRSIAVQLDFYGAIRLLWCQFSGRQTFESNVALGQHLSSLRLSSMCNLGQERHIPDPFAEAVGLWSWGKTMTCILLYAIIKLFNKYLLISKPGFIPRHQSVPRRVLASTVRSGARTAQILHCWSFCKKVLKR